MIDKKLISSEKCKIEPPENYDFHNVMYWNPESKELIKINEKAINMMNELKEKYSGNQESSWSHVDKILYEQLDKGKIEKATLLKKAKEFLRNECLEYQGTTGLIESWICKPIKSYNKTTYKLKIDSEKNITCNCQGFNSKLSNEGLGNCSHCLALIQHKFIMMKNQGEKGNI